MKVTSVRGYLHRIIKTQIHKIAHLTFSFSMLKQPSSKMALRPLSPPSHFLKSNAEHLCLAHSIHPGRKAAEQHTCPQQNPYSARLLEIPENMHTANSTLMTNGHQTPQTRQKQIVLFLVNEYNNQTKQLWR